MSVAKKFRKHDHIRIDTIFSLLPIFTVQQNNEFKNIEEKINGFDFGYEGPSLNMGMDFKLFCVLMRENCETIDINIKELLLLVGIPSKRFCKETKDSVLDSLDRLRKADFSFRNKYRRGGFSIIYETDYNEVSGKISILINKRLIHNMNKKDNKTFLNYEDLDKKFGKKLLHKKLYLLLKTYGNNKYVKLKWDNILLNLGINGDRNDAKKRVRKALTDLIKMKEIISFDNIDTDFIKIEMNEKAIKSKTKVSNIKNKKIENELPF